MVGQFHPIILHFPIVLFTAALVCDITNYFGKTEALTVGHWMIILAVITCIPTILTGLAAALPLDPNNPVVEKHRSLGYSTGIFLSLCRLAHCCYGMENSSESDSFCGPKYLNGCPGFLDKRLWRANHARNHTIWFRAGPPSSACGWEFKRFYFVKLL